MEEEHRVPPEDVEGLHIYYTAAQRKAREEGAPQRSLTRPAPGKRARRRRQEQDGQPDEAAASSVRVSGSDGARIRRDPCANRRAGAGAARATQ